MSDTTILIPTEDPNSPEQRAYRLKRLRNLANLSRRDMCTPHSAIQLNTLKGWEVAKYGGLSKTGAQKVIERVKQAGVECSLSWLLHGQGLPPVINDLQRHYTPSTELALPETALIMSELELFKQHCPMSLYTEIKDDSLLPYYQPKDWVAGPYSAPIEACKDAICIIELDSGECLVRKVLIGPDQAINLTAINPFCTAQPPILFGVQPIKLAPVTWHRKPTRAE